MKLIPLRQAQLKWMNSTKQKNFVAIKLLTFKKDRSVQIRKTEEGYVLCEQGYLDQTILLDEKNAKKQLKDAFSREFPRSTRLYIQEGGA